MDYFNSTLKLVDTGLISTNKSSMILKYCKKYNLKTVEDFINFYNKIDLIDEKLLNKNFEKDI